MLALTKRAIVCLALMATNTGISAETKQLIWKTQPGISVSECMTADTDGQDFEKDFARRASRIHGTPAGDWAIRHYLFAHLATAQLRWDAASRTLYLNGKLTPGALPAIAAEFERQPAPRRLVVNSFGGDSRTGMAIASLLSKYQVALTVQGFCMSSCANYLLPAAREVQLDNAVIGLHGSAAACNEKLSVWAGLRKWRLSDYLHFLNVAKLDGAFASNYPSLAEVITLSQEVDRGGKDGLARGWLVVVPARAEQLGIRVTSIKSTQTFDLLAADPDDSLIGKIHIF
jgi:hypothetical protein